ncbi:uncharacterized protein LOC128204643 [Mya arenaria]|uniref:uncharacterized protein LOC128204643 n=1 Tax=Mya arenaria TaxID=6604 RepID=UPI0022E8AD3B|nr:uncharacterized protein LOC128204643 [Mya arenaria]
MDSVTLSLLVFSCVAAAVLGEICTTNDNCVASTICASGSTVICQHPDGPGVVTDGGLCTCSGGGAYVCVLANECYAATGNAPNLNCEDNRRHCYDQQCICSRWPGFGKRALE